MSLELGHHRHRAGKVPHWHGKKEQIRVRIREEVKKGEKDLKNPNPNPRRKLGEEEKRTERVHEP